MPEFPKISNYEITLEIETGNLIYKSFVDIQDLLDFIKDNAEDPSKIRNIINPKKKIGEQLGFYSTDESDDDDDW